MTTDNGIRPIRRSSSSRAQAGVRSTHGSVTAGNASPLTDGGERRAPHERGAREIARLPAARYIRSYSYAALDPGEQLLMGRCSPPGRAAARGLTLVTWISIEMHEPFAAQVLCNLKGFTSREWAARAGSAARSATSIARSST
jgi:acetyl-CoA acyltransferase